MGFAGESLGSEGSCEGTSLGSESPLFQHAQCGATCSTPLFCFWDIDSFRLRKWLFTVELRNKRKCASCPHVPLTQTREREREKEEGTEAQRERGGERNCTLHGAKKGYFLPLGN